MKSLTVFAVALSCPVFFSSVQAGDKPGDHEPEPEPPFLETMVVSASRTPIPSKQAGSSITVITATELEQRQSTFVSDILQSVPGVDISRQGSFGALTQARIRGAEANQTLVLIDGIEVNDPAQDALFNFGHLTAGGIDRIEVLRGPQSSIWGADALSGVINIITEKGSGPPAVSVFSDAGSFNTREGGGRISGGGKNYHYSLHGRYFSTGGFNIAETGSEDDGYDNGTLSFKGGISPLDSLSLEAVFRHVDSTVEFDPVPAGVPVDADNETDADRLYGRVQASADLLGGNWQHLFGAAVTSTDNDNFANGMETTSTQGRKTRFEYQSNIFLDTPGFLDAAHTLIFALDSEREEFTQRGTPTIFGDPNQDQDITNQGYAVEYRLDLAGQLFLSGAVRRDENEVFDDATTGRGTIAWVHPVSGTKIHASYGTGVKNPTFVERFGFTPDTFFGNPDLQPERSKGWETGIEQGFYKGRLNIGITYFNERLEDEINGFFFDPALPPFGGFTAINVDGTSKREGYEIALNANPVAGLDIRGSYTYVDATQPDAAGIQRREIRRPEHNASIVANYRFMNDRANINFSLDYTDDIIDTNFGTFPATRVTLDSFLIANVAASYDLSDKITLFGRVENITDEDYQEIFGFETAGVSAFAGIRVNLDLVNQ